MPPRGRPVSEVNQRLVSDASAEFLRHVGVLVRDFSPMLSVAEYIDFPQRYMQILSLIWCSTAGVCSDWRVWLETCKDSRPWQLYVESFLDAVSSLGFLDHAAGVALWNSFPHSNPTRDRRRYIDALFNNVPGAGIEARVGMVTSILAMLEPLLTYCRDVIPSTFDEFFAELPPTAVGVPDPIDDYERLITWPCLLVTDGIVVLRDEWESTVLSDGDVDVRWWVTFNGAVNSTVTLCKAIAQLLSIARRRVRQTASQRERRIPQRDSRDRQIRDRTVDYLFTTPALKDCYVTRVEALPALRRDVARLKELLVDRPPVDLASWVDAVAYQEHKAFVDGELPTVVGPPVTLADDDDVQRVLSSVVRGSWCRE